MSSLTLQVFIVHSHIIVNNLKNLMNFYLTSAISSTCTLRDIVRNNKNICKQISLVGSISKFIFWENIFSSKLFLNTLKYFSKCYFHIYSEFRNEYSKIFLWNIWLIYKFLSMKIASIFCTLNTSYK